MNLLIVVMKKHGVLLYHAAATHVAYSCSFFLLAHCTYAGLDLQSHRSPFFNSSYIFRFPRFVHLYHSSLNSSDSLNRPLTCLTSFLTSLLFHCLGCSFQFTISVISKNLLCFQNSLSNAKIDISSH